VLPAFLLTFVVAMLARGAWAIVMMFVRIADHRRYRADVAAFQWSDTMTPREFENRCCEAMRIAGLHATHTGRSGDQGCDVLANRAGVRVALQCKRQHGHVGNRAVQEAHSARAFTKATHAAVVSNAGYTKSAVALAKATGVQLLHWRDLRHPDTLFGRH
jgi:restriction system protein